MRKLLIILCVCCEKEARIEIPYLGDKIVQNTLITDEANQQCYLQEISILPSVAFSIKF